MVASVTPIYPDVPNIGIATIATASTATDGTGATLLYTAGADGDAVEKVSVQHLGTNVATVLRIFLNNGLTPGTAANNALFKEITIAANTVSQVAQSIQTYEVLLNPGSSLKLPPNWRIYIAIGTTVAAGLKVTALGGNY